MTSWFKGHTKRFIKAPLLNDALLLEKQSSILNGKKATNPLHLTLTVIHVAEGTAHADYLTSNAFTDDVRDIFRIHSVAIHNPRYLMMGTKPECFTIVMDTKNDSYTQKVLMFKSVLSRLLCNKLELDYKECVIDDQYTYRVFYDKEGVEMLKIPYDIEATAICHLTLFTSFDLKRCNKALFKRYTTAGDKLEFLVNECGPIAEIMTADYTIECNSLTIS